MSETETPDNAVVDDNHIIADRRNKLAELRDQGKAYPNAFRRDTLAEHLHGTYGQRSADSLTEETQSFALAGRLMAKRVMGKASFARLQDMSGQIQLFLKQNVLGEEIYQAFKHMDVGDIVGVRGTLMKTRTGELSLRVAELELLSKSIRPLPEKWAGLP
ncbi:MAG: OB-fold nucleic acid binding domain-containing protein, partial [Sinobacteraceae bacterium]|nr:OB-fold nucleic acid binding domain-containing protein [Nevskiaceae bacterium]